MTSPINFTGLASGLDTSSIITQLMSIASQPQTQLKNQLSTSQQIGSAYQAIVAKLSAITTAVQGLGAKSQSVTLSTTSPVWTANKVDSSSTTVAASADGSAVPETSLTFDVPHLAKAQVSTVATPGGVAVSNPATTQFLHIVTAGDNVDHQVDISKTDGSAAAVAAAINSTANLNVRASVVNTDNGPILQLASTKTGAAAGFTVTGLDQPANTPIAAQDAQIAVGDPSAGGFTVSSSTNTFTGVATGVTFTVSAEAAGVTLAVGADTDAISKDVSAAVDAVNAALTTLGGYTGKGDLLQGNSTVDGIDNAFLSVVSDGAAGTSFARYGIQLTKDGQLAFDATTFKSAYEADPGATQKAISDLAQSLSDKVDALTDISNGTITLASQSAQSQQDRLNTEISDWTDRLTQQQQVLQAKFSAMESAIQKLNSQGSYLTSIFNSMNGGSSSSSSKSS